MVSKIKKRGGTEKWESEIVRKGHRVDDVFRKV